MPDKSRQLRRSRSCCDRLFWNVVEGGTFAAFLVKHSTKLSMLSRRQDDSATQGKNLFIKQCSALGRIHATTPRLPPVALRTNGVVQPHGSCHRSNCGHSGPWIGCPQNTQV